MKVAQPLLVHDQSYGDISQFARAINWDLDFRQLDSGPLDAHVSVILGQGINISRFDLNRGFHQIGSPPTNMLTFGVLDVNTAEISWCSHSMPGGAMANFNLENGIDCVSHSGFAGYGVSLHIDLLQYLAEQMNISTNVEALARSRVNWLSPHTLNLGRKLASVFEQAMNAGPHALYEHAEFINEEIGRAVLSELKNHDRSGTIATPAHKKRVLSKALEILENPEQLPITVSKLCELASTSSSTLHRVFQAEFGVSPKEYIRARCLSAVRDELASAPPGSSISDIANRWGFWHMGQFAHDYRLLFGELPSQHRSLLIRKI